MCVCVCVCLCIPVHIQCTMYRAGLISLLPPSPTHPHLTRFFFKSFCEEIDDAIMEEISDEGTILPHFEGKIIARVETVA